MKTMLFVVFGLVLCAFLLVGFLACQRATAHNCKNGVFAQHKADWIKKELTQKLELTDTQVAEIDRIIETVKAKHAQMHTMPQDLRNDFFNELRKDQLSAEQVRQLFEHRRPAFEQMLTVISEAIADFHAVLTPEQREKFIAELKAHHKRCPWRKHG
jgi:protein CpxP